MVHLDKGVNFFVEHRGMQGIFDQLDLTRYPERETVELIKSLAHENDVSYPMITLGNGAADLIDLLCEVCLGSTDEAIILDTTYSYYETAIRKRHATMRRAPTTPNGSFSLEATLECVNEKTRLVFIDSPSNPFGYVVSTADLKAILEYTSAYVVVDEEYIEYGGKSALPLLKHHSNLVILRSFSKWAGLAGARVGYALAHSDVTYKLAAAQPPYGVNALSLRAALYALQHKTDLLAPLEEFEKVRNYVVMHLATIGYTTVSRIVPYIVIQGTAESMVWLYAAFLDGGYQTKLLTIKNSHAIRLTIPPMAVARNIIQIAHKVHKYELSTKVTNN